MSKQVNAYKISAAVMVLLNAPFLMVEQIEFLCLHRVGVPPNNCYDENNWVNLIDFAKAPVSPCHDDEENEPLAHSYARDEEAEEKPRNRKKAEDRKEQA